MANMLIQYLEWHFADTPKGILRAWGNCLKFNLEYWSVFTMIKTFFSHWRRYKEDYGRGFDSKRFFEALIFNAMSRVMGAIFRSFLIALGILTEVLILFAGLVVFLLWILLPLIIIFSFVYGLKLLF